MSAPVPESDDPVVLRALPYYEPVRGHPLRRKRSLRSAPPPPALPPLPGPTWDEAPGMHRRLCRLVGTLLEVLDGNRPVAQVRTLLSDTVYEAAVTRARAATATGVRYQLRTLRSCRPCPDAIELAAVVEVQQRGRKGPGRDHAAAIRLDRGTDGWICTALILI